MQIEVLGDRYQLQDPIGRGGMATIYRGRDIRMDRVVAIKVLREVYSTDPKFVTRFQREAKAASLLQHPNIVQVYDYGQSDGNYFIVMELVEGTDLRRYLRSRGMLAVDRAIIIAHDVALGLGAAHRRDIVHRDVKPQNVLVGRDGSIKLTDFGIASVYKDINAERLTTTGMTLGTVQYYAPEQAQGEIVSPAADVYALGIVMYEMLTSKTPFDGDTPVAVAMQHIQEMPVPPRQHNPNIPPVLEEIIMRCLEKTPAMRFRDGNSLARALEMLGEEELMAPPTVAGGPTIAVRPQPGIGSNGAYAPPMVSSPNHMLPASFQQAPVQDGMIPPAHQGFGSFPGVDHQMGFNSSPMAGGSGATRPFNKNALGGVPEERESRFASIITVLILLATLLLLGFSVYLAGVLGYIPGLFPGSNPSNETPTQQVTFQKVPDLKGKELKDAQKAASDLGFKVVVANGLTEGIVISQDTPPNTEKEAGTEIKVTLAAPSPVVKVPDLKGKTLEEAGEELKKQGIEATFSPDNTAPPGSTPNTVTRTTPEAGTTLKPDDNVIVYFVPAVTPTPIPTPEPTLEPTPEPTPEPTEEPTPTPTAKATKTPKPTKSPTQAVTPDATQASTPSAFISGGSSGSDSGSTPLAAGFILFLALIYWRTWKWS